MEHLRPDPARYPTDPAVLRLRTVQRVISDLRRGTPVFLGGPAPLLIVAAETADEVSLQELATLSAGPPLLLLSAVRAAALLRRPVDPSEPVVALRGGPSWTPAVLHGAADPTRPQGLLHALETTSAPPLAAAALTLAKLARVLPTVIAGPIGPEGTARAASAGLLAVTATDVLTHDALVTETLTRVAEAAVPLEVAEDARLVAFRPATGAVEHVAIVIGQPDRVSPDSPAPLVRIHSECFTGDLLGSLRCDCGPQLRAALARIGAEGVGVILYLAQEGRGIGLAGKLRAYALQDRGLERLHLGRLREEIGAEPALDTVDANRALGWQADERHFGVAARMLEALGVRRLRLLTNNPDKLSALAAGGLTVEGREAITIPPNGHNDAYLATKLRRLGHLA